MNYDLEGYRNMVKTITQEKDMIMMDYTNLRDEADSLRRGQI